MSDATATMPLYLVDAGGIYKIGIEVSLDGGQTFQMYEFDTGGKGFWVADDAAWGPVTQGAGTLTNNYSSGMSYTAVPVTGSVSLRATNGETLTTTGTIAQIETASGPYWNADNAATGGPPLYSAFYGDFGASLADKEGLETFLKQFGTAYAAGFIVTLNSLADVGPIAPGQTEAIGTLQLGLTPDQITAYDAYGTIAMQGQTISGSDAYDYAEQLVNGTLTVNGGTLGVQTGVVLDTGAPSSFIPGGDSFTVGTPIDSVTLTAGDTTLLDFTLGGDQSQNVLGYPSDGAGAYINTGLNAFFGESVMFDVTGGAVAIQPACFAAGTRLLTPEGLRLVEDLRPGDRLVTVEGAVLPIRWVGQRSLDCTRHPAPAKVWPVRIAPHAFGPGQPARPLLLSPDHAIFAEGVLIPVKHLLNGDSIRQMRRRHVTYHHVELPRHAVILAEGLPAESYLDTGDRQAFAGGAGPIALHPAWGAEARDVALIQEALGAAPVRVTGPEITRLRARLAAACPTAAAGLSLRAARRGGPR
ncbi:Hint domain-containing protein [Acidisoma sp. 7E03]